MRNCIFLVVGLVLVTLGGCDTPPEDSGALATEEENAALSSCTPPEELVSYANVASCRIPVTAASPGANANAYALGDNAIDCYAPCTCTFAAGVSQGTCTSRGQTETGHNTYCGVIPAIRLRAAIDTAAGSTQTAGVQFTLRQSATTMPAGTVACNAAWRGYTAASRNNQCNAACIAQQTWMQAQMNQTIFCCARPAANAVAR